MDKQAIGHFFDTLTKDYTEAIEKCFPRYREMLWALLEYLPSQRTFESVLELGCGTGNLSVLLHQAFPHARLHMVDISGDSLEACRQRLGNAAGLSYAQQDFSQAHYGVGAFDLVVSSISIHHLESAAKRTLFQRVHQWLVADGVFNFADQCAGATTDINTCHIQNWRTVSMEAGSSDAEWNMWMQHQADHDHHDTLGQQMDWLDKAGFASVDCPWRYLLWSVIQARK